MRTQSASLVHAIYLRFLIGGINTSISWNENDDNSDQTSRRSPPEFRKSSSSPRSRRSASGLSGSPRAPRFAWRLRASLCLLAISHPHCAAVACQPFAVDFSRFIVISRTANFSAIRALVRRLDKNLPMQLLYAGERFLSKTAEGVVHQVALDHLTLALIVPGVSWIGSLLW